MTVMTHSAIPRAGTVPRGRSTSVRWLRAVAVQRSRTLAHHIVIAADPVIGIGLATLAGRHVEVGIVPGEAALDATRDPEPPDALVLATPDPTDVLDRLRHERPGFPCLAVTAGRIETAGLAALRAGAVGVVALADAVDTFGPALAAVLRGDPHIPPKLGAALTRRLGRPADPNALSARERQVVLAVVSGQTPAEIARTLALARETVATYRRRALVKLALRTDADLTRHALREGWLPLDG